MRYGLAFLSIIIPNTRHVYLIILITCNNLAYIAMSYNQYENISVQNTAEADKTWRKLAKEQAIEY